MDQGNSHPDEQFVRNITGHQHRLYGLILSMLPDPERARDVLQETNVVIWRKFQDFSPGTDFGAWAAKIAYLQVAAYRTSRGRDRHVFDDELLAVLSEEAEMSSSAVDERTVALESCMERLEERERQLLKWRYTQGNTVADLAKIIGKSPNATRVALFRLRHLLLECIQGKMAQIQD